MIRREKELGDMAKLNDELLHKKGFKKFRYFKEGKGIINSLRLTEFRSDVEYDKPALYFRFQNAPLVLQSDRIIVIAEDETKANKLIDKFISKYVK